MRGAFSGFQFFWGVWTLATLVGAIEEDILQGSGILPNKPAAFVRKTNPLASFLGISRENVATDRVTRGWGLLATPTTSPTNPTAKPTVAPSHPTAAPTVRGTAPSAVPTVAPSNHTAPTTPSPTRKPVYSHHPTLKPSFAPSHKPRASCPPVPPSAKTASGPFQVAQSILPTGYWVRLGWMSHLNTQCSGTPDYQWMQALGQCYVITSVYCGVTSYQSYSYVLQQQNTMGGAQSSAIYKIQYRDANCKVAFQSSPVGLVVPNQCEDYEDQNVMGGGAGSYFVQQYVSVGATPPPVIVTGVQQLNFANSAECQATVPKFTSMSVIGQNFCIKRTVPPSTSQQYQCDSKSAITTTYYKDNGECNPDIGGGTADQSNALIVPYLCNQKSTTDSSKYYQTNTCVLSGPTPAPTTYQPGQPTYSPTKQPGQIPVGYWVTQYYAGKKCNGDPYYSEYTAIGLCVPTSADDANFDANNPIQGYTMVDVAVDDLGTTMWQYYFADSACLERNKGFAVESIRGMNNGRCVFDSYTGTSYSYTIIKGSTPPFIPKKVTFPVILRDVYASEGICDAVQRDGEGLTSKPGQFPTRGDMFACGVCTPYFSNPDNGMYAKTNNYFMVTCNQADPNAPKLSYANFTDPKCTPQSNAPVLTPIPMLSTIDSQSKKATCLKSSSYASVPNTDIDADLTAGSYETILCVGHQRAPTAVPTTAPTSLTSVVIFDVKQQLDNVPFVDTEMAEREYKQAIVGAIAEAMSISEDSVEDLVIDPGSERRRTRTRRRLQTLGGSGSGSTVFGSVLAWARRQLDAPAPAAPSGAQDTPELGKNSILISYTIDTKIGTATIAGLEDTLTQAVQDGTLDALMASRSNGNTSALANVQCSLPEFSGEVYNSPTAKKVGFPAYGIALIAISVAVILCGSGYGYYYYKYERNKHLDNQHLMHGQSDSSELEMQSGGLQPRPRGEEQPDAWGGNPYAGQIKASRRVSTQGSTGNEL